MLAEEERKARKREAYKRWREKHPITDKERKLRNARSKERRMKKKNNMDDVNGTARHPSIDFQYCSKAELKKRKEKHEKEIRENEEAKAIGISYGKYQMLKQQGKLPRHIPLPEKKKPKKLGVYVPAQRGLSEFNAARERIFVVAAEKINEERRQKRVACRTVERTASNYMERMRKQKEAVERATAGSNQSDC